MPELAPYHYFWSLQNNSYKIRSLMDYRRILKGDTATWCFVIGNSQGNVSADLDNSLSDIREFQASGGKVIISVGGANGPFIWNMFDEERLFQELKTMVEKTGCKSYDFDIEGADVANINAQEKLSKALVRLQGVFSDLEISYTLPVMSASQWDKGGLTTDGMNLMRKAVDLGVKIDVLNIMTMNYYAPLTSGKTWGLVACEVGDRVVDQMKEVWPEYSREKLYSMLGVCPMIGVNDDGATFSVSDMDTVCSYALKNKIARISFWATQRDQVGDGSLAIYSKANKTDYKYYNTARNRLFSNTPSTPTPTPTTPMTSKPPRVIYYHCNWSCYGRNFQIKDIPREMEDISYAFFNVNADGSIVTGDAWADTDKRYTGADGVPPPDTWDDSVPGKFYGNFGQIKKLQDSGRNLRVSLSVGGWSWSKNFSPAVSTPQTRSKFVSDVISLFKKYPIFSGISIDWEYVSNDGVNYGNSGNIATPQDSANLILLIRQLRQAFNENGMNNYTIAMCTVADPAKAKFDVENTHPLLDELHVMT